MNMIGQEFSRNCERKSSFGKIFLVMFVQMTAENQIPPPEHFPLSIPDLRKLSNHKSTKIAGGALVLIPTELFAPQVMNSSPPF